MPDTKRVVPTTNRTLLQMLRQIGKRNMKARRASWRAGRWIRQDVPEDGLFECEPPLHERCKRCGEFPFDREIMPPRAFIRTGDLKACDWEVAADGTSY